jgi:hypothetical protein
MAPAGRDPQCLSVEKVQSTNVNLGVKDPSASLRMTVIIGLIQY